MPIEEAARLMASHVPPVAELERMTLAEALGRVVAADVISPLALPSFDNSAVDGYAVRHADLARTGETRLKIAGRVQAGSRDACGHPAGRGGAYFYRRAHAARRRYGIHAGRRAGRGRTR
jgi:molybdopterin molybdotransferase